MSSAQGRRVENSSHHGGELGESILSVRFLGLHGSHGKERMREEGMESRESEMPFFCSCE